jgi:hypothetical protein
VVFIFPNGMESRGDDLTESLKIPVCVSARLVGHILVPMEAAMNTNGNSVLTAREGAKAGEPSLSDLENIASGTADYAKQASMFNLCAFQWARTVG